ncbi:MAG: phage tail tube protein [Bryobacteraceae bacterium]
MAQPEVIAGTKLLLLVGDGASPEVFGEPCGLTTKAFDLSASTNTTLIPDCDDPEAPAWEATDINALSGSATGNGVMAVASFAIWNDWFMSATGKNMQIKLDHASLGYYSGSFKLTGFKLSGTRGNKVLVDVTIKNDGAVIWTDNP